MPDRVRIGVLASGEGTTLQALIDAIALGALDAEIVVVISNNADSGAGRRAHENAIAFEHLSSRTHPDPRSLDEAICAALEGHNVKLVQLAGYMKKLGEYTVSHFRGHVLNTHPALLPDFGGPGMYGHHVHEAILAAGVAVTGVSIHVVDGNYDTGPLVAQCEVPVLPGDDADALAERVQQRERAFLVDVLQSIVEGRITLARSP